MTTRDELVFGWLENVALTATDEAVEALEEALAIVKQVPDEQVGAVLEVAGDLWSPVPADANSSSLVPVLTDEFACLRVVAYAVIHRTLVDVEDLTATAFTQRLLSCEGSERDARLRGIEYVREFIGSRDDFMDAFGRDINARNDEAIDGWCVNTGAGVTWFHLDGIGWIVHTHP